MILFLLRSQSSISPSLLLKNFEVQDEQNWIEIWFRTFSWVCCMVCKIYCKFL